MIQDFIPVVRVLALSTLGNPRDEKVWSRFPSNVIQAVESSDSDRRISIVSHSLEFPKRINHFLNILEKLGFGIRDRGFVRRVLLSIRIYCLIILERPDSLFLFGTGCVPMFAKQLRIQKIVFIDSVQEEWEGVSTWSIETPKSHWLRFLQMEHRLLRASTLVCCLTHRTAHLLESLYDIESSKIQLLGTGPGIREINLYKQAFESRKRLDHEIVIATVVRQRARDKGLDILVSAIPLVETELPIRLRVFGKPIKEFEALEYVEFLDLNPDDYLISLAKSDLFAFPARYEPYGLAFLDAALLKLPIITSSNAGIGVEMSQFCPTYVCSASIDSLKSQIEFAINDLVKGEKQFDETTSFSEKTLSASRFLWEETGKRLAEILAT